MDTINTERYYAIIREKRVTIKLIGNQYKINGPYNFDLLLDRLSLDPLHSVNLYDRSVKVPLVIDRISLTLQKLKQMERQKALHL